MATIRELNTDSSFVKNKTEKAIENLLKPEACVTRPFLFRDTAIKLIYSGNLEYKELTKAT